MAVGPSGHLANDRFAEKEHPLGEHRVKKANAAGRKTPFAGLWRDARVLLASKERLSLEKTMRKTQLQRGLLIMFLSFASFACSRPTHAAADLPKPSVDLPAAKAGEVK
ncbi:MAG: hypothetical protein ACREJC_01860, partial [Tepidisphaeraceae bacterium]